MQETQEQTKSRGVAAGIVAGVVLGAVLFAMGLATYGEFAVMNVTNENVSDLVRKRYGGYVAWTQIKIFLTYAGLGAILGAIAGSWVRMKAAMKNRRPSRRAAFLKSLGIAALVYLLMLLHSVSYFPQHYTSLFYERGGVLAAFQSAVTDHTSPLLYAVLLLALVLAYAVRTIRRFWNPEIAAGLAVALGLVISTAITQSAIRNATPAEPVIGKLPNILILSADSLRPDRLSCYGYPLDTSPTIDALAKKGTVFQNAFTTLPRTFPAWISYLTGMYPHNHGVRDMFPDRKDMMQNRSVVRELARVGYRTAVISDYAGDIFTRLDIGFEHIDAPVFNFKVLIAQRSLELHRLLFPLVNNRYGRLLFPELAEFADNSDPRLLADRVIRYIEDRDQSEPFFLTVFFSASHFPFAAPYPYYRMFTDPDYRGPTKYHKPADIFEVPVPPREIARIGQIFDGSVRSVDDQMGRILKVLERKGLTENTIVLVASDHGESLYEDGYDLGHGDHFHGNVSVRIPLVIMDPRSKGGVVADRFVSGVDFSPTLLDLAGLPIPPWMEGDSLTPLMKGKRWHRPDEAFLETGLWFVPLSLKYFENRRIDYPDISVMGKVDFKRDQQVFIKPEYRDIIRIAKHRMLLTPEWKLLYIPTSRGVRWELYDRKNDPWDTRELSGEMPGVARILKDRLLGWASTCENCKISNEFILPRK